MVTNLKNSISYNARKKSAAALLSFFFFFTFTAANAQSNVKEYSDIINIQLTNLLSQVNHSNSNFSLKFKNDLSSISDLFFNYDSNILNPSDGSDLNNDQQLIMDFKNYNQILSYYLDTSIEHNDTLLTYMKEDLRIKTTTVFAWQSYSSSKRMTLQVKVMNKTQTVELPGYDVFVKPYRSLDPNLRIPLNPTNNAVIDIRPGNKKVSIYFHNVLVEEREVPVYYKENSIIPVIFIVQ